MASFERKGSDSSVIDEKASGIVDVDNEKGKLDYVPGLPADVAVAEVGDVAEDVRAIDLGADGKERPIEEAGDYALRLVSLEDDPTLPVHTFRTWFLGLGLACFAAVLGELFVRAAHVLLYDRRTRLRDPDSTSARRRFRSRVSSFRLSRTFSV